MIVVFEHHWEVISQALSPKTSGGNVASHCTYTPYHLITGTDGRYQKITCLYFCQCCLFQTTVLLNSWQTTICVVEYTVPEIAEDI